MDASSVCRTPRRGFTLVELLVVIVIIGLLAGLLTPAVIAVMKNANVAAIKAEIHGVGMAVESYKTERTEYPPDCFGLHPDYPNDVRDAAKARIVRHFRKAFPRYVPGMPSNSSKSDPWERFKDDFVAGNPGLDLDNLTPASVLVFCLSGPPDPTTKQLLGFSANPKNPFQAGGGRLTKLGEFKENKLQGFDEAANAWTQWPTYAAGKTKLPLVYFRPRRCAASDQTEYAYESGGNLLPLYYIHSDGNICVPYLAEATDPANPGTVGPNNRRRWCNAESFQIISSGLDDEFGDGSETVFRISGTGRGFSPNNGDADNITNFSRGMLEDEVEAE